MNDKYNVTSKIPMSEDGRTYQVTVNASKLQEVIDELASKVDFSFKNIIDPTRVDDLEKKFFEQEEINEVIKTIIIQTFNKILFWVLIGIVMSIGSSWFINEVLSNG